MEEICSLLCFILSRNPFLMWKFEFGDKELSSGYVLLTWCLIETFTFVLLLVNNDMVLTELYVVLHE